MNCSSAYEMVDMNWTYARRYYTNPCFVANNCTVMHMCQQFPTNTAVPVYGYVTPILIFMTIVNNTLVSVVLLRKNMRSPTNSLLVSMAIADTLTGIFALVYMRFYSTDNYRDYVPYNWCYIVTYVGVYIPTIFHTVSIWLTVALAVQRYIYVCHSFVAKAICTTKNVIIGTFVIYVVSIFVHSSRFFEHSYERMNVMSIVDPTRVVESCVSSINQWVRDADPKIYYNIYFWFRVIFIHLVPCTSLVLLNLLLIFAMRKAQKRRKILLKQNRRSECKRLKDSNCTTLMLIAVVGLFLLVEFPLGIVILLHIIQNTFSIRIMTTDVGVNLGLFANMLILLSYPLNFFIYCGMSRQFRTSFKRLFVKGDDLERDGLTSQYHVLPTENGKSTALTTCV